MNTDSRIGLIGAGYFGQIILKTLAEMGLVPMFVADPVLEPGTIDVTGAGGELSKMTTVVDIEPHLGDLDAVIIATPPDTHIDLIIKAVNADCHVFCEKPLTIPDPTRPTHAIGLLMHEAKHRRLSIHVDHTLCYCPKRIDAMSQGSEILAVRENGELNKHGISVVWDLLVHEVAAALMVNGARPDTIEIVPQDPTRDRVEVKLGFTSRRWVIQCENGSSQQRGLYVDGRPVETTAEALVEDVPPLIRSLGRFFDSIRGDRPFPSITGLNHALDVAYVLEVVDRLIAESMDDASLIEQLNGDPGSITRGYLVGVPR